MRTASQMPQELSRAHDAGFIARQAHIAAARRRLSADVVAARARVAAQLDEDPTHEVAIAMFKADWDRATMALEVHIAAYGPL